MLVLSYFSACFFVLFTSFVSAISTVRAVVRLDVQALDRVFLACNSNAFGVPNPSTTFNYLLTTFNHLSTTFCCHCSVQHFIPSARIPFSTAHCTAITFNALWLCLIYPGPANFLHPARRCSTVSLNLLHNLHYSWSVIPCIFFHLFLPFAVVG